MYHEFFLLSNILDFLEITRLIRRTKKYVPLDFYDLSMMV